MPKAPRLRPILRALSIFVGVIWISGSIAGCDGETTESAPSSPSGSASSTATSETTSGKQTDPSSGSPTQPVVASRKAPPESAPRHPNERPMPAFEGRTVAGTRLAMRDLLGSRVLLFLFNPEVDDAKPVAEAVNRVSKIRGEHNFEIVGVGVGSTASALSRFVQSEGLEFPVLDDSDGTITAALRLRAPVAILGIDAEGYMTFGLGAFPHDGDVVGAVETTLRENLRLPEAGAHGSGELLAYPQAPELGVIAMSNGEVLETADLEGRAAVVIFFLHTCPHCHNALAALKTTLASIAEEKRPRLVAISIQNDPRSVRASLKELGLDFFDPYLDPSGQATERWGITGGVPVVLVLDPQGRIRYRTAGWDEKRDAGIVRMKLSAAAGARVPMLLDPTGYSGNDVCGTCHEQEYATWEYTSHATAFDTLVTHAADRRKDCIGCHVVGYEQTGGYDFTRRPPHLENVGCESCHGRGGPHLSPSFVPDGDYAQVCATCHNATHSLGFEFETFHSRVSHDAIAALPGEERAKLLEGGGPSRNLLPTQAEYVGSNACQSCHAKEFETWLASPHGNAVASLEKKGEADDVACLACHTTAYGKPGGFPANAPVSAHRDLARVGCESCHGPGGDHIGENVRRVGTILSLGDKCDSCVILKICGTCHDDDNDPGFPFRVEERIETQRHGTIEAAATRGDESADRARLHEAFERFAVARDGHPHVRPSGSGPSGSPTPVEPSGAPDPS